MVYYRQPFKGSFPITQKYGEVIEGVTYKGLPHTGIDYACPEGTPILASADGVVKAAKEEPNGYGKYIILEHADGKATLYAHLWYFVQLFEGKQVKQGDLIAYSDSSGNSTGPHLHFEAREKWNDYKSHRDPMTFLPLMDVVDAVPKVQNMALHPDVRTGPCRVCCTAYVRDWNTLERKYLLNTNDVVYAFDGKKIYNDLPFRFIGANLCIAEYDMDGTQILESIYGEEK